MVHFTDNSISGLPIQAFGWNFGDGNYAYIQSPTHIFNNPGTYNVSLDIYNSGGFYSTMTHQIAIHSKPIVVVNDPTICIGDSATLTATGALTYTWSNGLLPGDVKKVAPTIATSYIVTGTGSFGCKNKDTSLVTVNPLPIINISNDTICKGDMATLSASGGNSYLWSNGATTPTITVNPSVTTDFGVTVTSNEGCKDSSFATSFVNQPPILSITASHSICEGTSTTLTVGGGVYYQWDNGFNTASITVNPITDTVYTVEVTDTNGCKNDTSTSVTIILNPVALITADFDTVCIGNHVTLSANGGNSFLWNTGEKSSTIIVYPTNQTTYTCTVSNISNGISCSNTSNYQIYAEDCNTIYIPNAFAPIGINKIFKPKGSFPAETEYYMAIYNRWGQLIFETQDYEMGWDGTFKGKLVEAGVYIYYVRVRFGGQKKSFERTGSVTIVE